MASQSRIAFKIRENRMRAAELRRIARGLSVEAHRRTFERDADSLEREAAELEEQLGKT